MLKCLRIKSTILSWLEDLPEFQKSSNYSNNISVEENQTDLLILMKLLLMELLSKLLLLLVKEVQNVKIFYFLTLSHFLSVLKLLEESWLLLLKETLVSQPKNNKSLQLIKTTNLVSLSKFSKVKEKWPKTTTNLVNSHLMVFLLLEEVSHKSKLPLMLIKMVSWTSALVINLLVKTIKL